ncbi:MAG: carboxypeptidase-like regulatory domain-containing protein [Candidatus Cybelea sp.]
MQFAVLLALSQFFFWSSPIDWQMNQQNVVIRGTVLDDSTGRPVPGATVYATSAAFDARTVSDSKGQFIFLTLFPGTYYLGASKNDAGDIYGSRGYEPPPLYAGFEYGATILVSHATN